jgi:hypothetical protein
MIASFNKTKRAVYAGLATLLLGLCLGTLAGAAPPGQGGYPAEASRVHVVYLVNNHGDDFGTACQKDCDGLRAALEKGFGSYRDRLVHHDLTRGNPLTKQPYTLEQMQDYIRDLELGPNDIVVVFFSGHGRIADPTRPADSHFFLVTNGVPGAGQQAFEIRRGWIQSTLLARNPRALVILSDCCSAFHRAPPAAGVRGLDLGQPRVNPATVQALFLRVRGLVSITAAEDGTCGITGYRGANPGNAGSAFTVAMLRLLYDPSHTYSAWSDFFPTLRQETALASGNAHQARQFHLPASSPLSVVR